MASYDPATALLVVDVQNDFADPRGSLAVTGGDGNVEGINREIAKAQDAGAFVVYTQDWHPPATPHFAKDAGTWPVHCVQETWGAALYPGLHVVGPVVRKGTRGEDGYSGFSMQDVTTSATISTGLEALLRSRGITRVVIAGLATDYCVKETALDATRLGFATVVLTALTRAPARDYNRQHNRQRLDSAPASLHLAGYEASTLITHTATSVA